DLANAVHRTGPVRPLEATRPSTRRGPGEWRDTGRFGKRRRRGTHSLSGYRNYHTERGPHPGRRRTMRDRDLSPDSRTPPPRPLPETERGSRKLFLPLSASGRGLGGGVRTLSLLLLLPCLGLVSSGCGKDIGKLPRARAPRERLPRVEAVQPK